MPRTALTSLITLALASIASGVDAAVTVFTNKSAWQNVTGSHTTIGFVGYPQGLNIGDLYSDLGVTFTDGQDWIWFGDTDLFPNDSWGFDGGLNDASTIVFDEPLGSIAVDFPGAVKFTLFSSGEIIYESPLFIPAGIGNFRGLVSTKPFDSVIIADPTGVLAVDDLHFGPPIPAPGVLCMLIAAMMAARRRRDAVSG